MKILAAFFAVLALLMPVSGQQITVAAAADLNYALKDLGATYEHKTGAKVRFSFGASGTLYSQIQNGAPFDLFFSADSEYPKKLAAAGLMDGGSLTTYATGHLVVWHPMIIQRSDYRPQPAESLAGLLLSPAVKRIAIANPEHAPYGRAAMAMLEHYGLKEKVTSKLVMGENISQAVQFVQSGNAQVGIVAESLVKSPTMKGSRPYDMVPQESYPEIRQVAGIVTASKQKKAAQAFLDFVRSPEAAPVLERYGLGVPATQ